VKILRVAPIPALTATKAEDYLRTFGPYAEVFYLSGQATLERICTRALTLGGVDVVVFDSVRKGTVDPAVVAAKTGATVLLPVYDTKAFDSRNLTIVSFSHYEEAA
jgi:hypothetical protein